MPKPRNSDAATQFGDFGSGAHSIDNAHDLMTRHERKSWIVEIAVYNVKISSTDGASLYLNP